MNKERVTASEVLFVIGTLCFAILLLCGVGYLQYKKLVGYEKRIVQVEQRMDAVMEITNQYKKRIGGKWGTEEDHIRSLRDGNERLRAEYFKLSERVYQLERQAGLIDPNITQDNKGVP